MLSFSKKLYCAMAVAVLAGLASPRIVWAHGGGSSGSHMSVSHASMGSSQMAHMPSSYPTKTFKQTTSKMSTLKSTSTVKSSSIMNKFSSSKKIVAAPNGNTGINGSGLPGKSSGSMSSSCFSKGYCGYGCSPWFGGFGNYGCGFGGYGCGFGSFGLFGYPYGYGYGYGSYGCYPWYSSGYYPYSNCNSILTPVSSVLPVSSSDATSATAPSSASAAVATPMSEPTVADPTTVQTASVATDSAM